MIDEAVTRSPAAFPTAAQIATMYTLAPLPPEQNAFAPAPGWCGFTRPDSRYLSMARGPMVQVSIHTQTEKAPMVCDISPG